MSPGSELIVTEKENAARRIAEILSDGTATTTKVGDVAVYEWDDTRCLGLSGHVVGVDFPPEYEDWRNVEPAELVDAPVVTEPTQPELVDALRRLARDAARVIIATDYDREGELIGKEAYRIVRDVDETVPIDRVRFSSITEGAVQGAFDTPEELDFQLAAAGEARQEIDLRWGAALTRFLSLSAGRLGDDFISVGRVQGPTLKLLVDREREIRAFDPEPYWELSAELAAATDPDGAFEADFFSLDADGSEAGRIWDGATADALAAALDAAGGATVDAVRRRVRTDDPPAPFDTTAYISAAGSLGCGASRAMSVAEELYTAGYVTYPRTDNTVYPDDLDPAHLLESFVGHHPFDEDAQTLLDGDVEPTAGDEETTDHPPIHPTGEVPDRAALSEEEWELYELIVRRFLATCAEPATWERLRVVALANGAARAAAADLDPRTALRGGDQGQGQGQDRDDGTGNADRGGSALPSLVADGGLRLKANGKRLLEAGYLDVYPYASRGETVLPEITEGDELSVDGRTLAAKETQPPRRYGQSRLIETMAELGIGTKSTRHNTVETLYDRGYVEGDPPRPTGLAEAVVDAAEAFADRVVSEEMTAQLEADMTAIARGERDLEAVTAESRALLETVFDELTDSREAVGDRLRASLKADRTLGPCPDCGESLLVRQAGDGSYFVGCDGYPDCEYTLPLPATGEPQALDETCDEHGLRHVKMLAGRKTFVHGCPQCRADAADEAEDRVVGDCPDCGADHGGDLAVKRLRSGSRLIGCTRYPDCDYSLPLPRRGAIEVTDERCDEHDLPFLVVGDEGDGDEDGDREGDGDATADDRWELGCPICNYREYRARQEGSELQVVDGIGEKTAEKLEAAGVESVRELKRADPDELAGTVDGISAESVRDWQSAAD